AARLQRNLYENVLKRLRLENRKIANLLALIRVPANEVRVLGSDCVFDIRIGSRLLKLVIKGSHDVLPRFVKRDDAILAAVTKLVRKHADSEVDHRPRGVDRTVIAAQTLQGAGGVVWITAKRSAPLVVRVTAGDFYTAGFRRCDGNGRYGVAGPDR